MKKVLFVTNDIALFSNILIYSKLNIKDYFENLYPQLSIKNDVFMISELDRNFSGTDFSNKYLNFGTTDIVIYLHFGEDFNIDNIYNETIGKLTKEKNDLIAINLKEKTINSSIVYKTPINNCRATFSNELVDFKDPCLRILSLIDQYFHTYFNNVNKLTFDEALEIFYDSILYKGVKIELSKIQKEFIRRALEGNNLLVNSPRQTGKTITLCILHKFLSLENTPHIFMKSCDIKSDKLKDITFSDQLTYEVCEILRKKFKGKSDIFLISDFEFISNNLILTQDLDSIQYGITLEEINARAQDENSTVILESTYNKNIQSEVKDYINRIPIGNMLLDDIIETMPKYIQELYDSYPYYVRQWLRKYQHNRYFMRLIYRSETERIKEIALMTNFNLPTIMNEFILNPVLRF